MPIVQHACGRPANRLLLPPGDVSDLSALHRIRGILAWLDLGAETYGWLRTLASGSG
jgi:hypothetical protein